MPKRSKLTDEERKKRKRESAKRWNRNNRERFNENKRKSYSKHRDEILSSYSKEYKRSWYLEKTYGLTLEAYDTLFKGQDSRCAVCGADEPGNKHNWHVDHCHETEKVRGILCHHCNAMLGMARDNPAFLAAGIEYLEKHHGQ